MTGPRHSFVAALALLLSFSSVGCGKSDQPSDPPVTKSDSGGDAGSKPGGSDGPAADSGVADSQGGDAAGGQGSEGGGDSAGGGESGGGDGAGDGGTVDCNGEPCAAPKQCLTYYGIAGPSGPAFHACELPCTRKGKSDDCPEGTRCITVADGPGDVCR
ncbi:MAG: hypothetical protein KC431_06565 [Myxococcales bacterium]|nr:hypothetical protein [Myxococcales bacterium]